MEYYHALAIEEIFKQLSTNKNGLTSEEIKRRTLKFGANILPREKKISSWGIFLSQFRSPLIYILFLAGLITIFLSDYTDAIVIFIAVFVNSTVGFIQENKASNALEALKKVIKNNVTVLRSGQKKEISQAELVVGDILILRQGDKVSADGRLFEAENIKANEASLTGEWLASDKGIDLINEETPLADRKNMVYMGTLIEAGYGKAVVVATAEKTEIGKIAKLISETKEEETPYQKKLVIFGRLIAVVVIILSILIFILGIKKGENFVDIFTTSVALAVAAIPEGLPIAMTVVLALGMQRILKRKGLVRKLSAAESLGSTTVICVDKTGTLTEGRMEVDQLQKIEPKTLEIAGLCSEAYLENSDGLETSRMVFHGRPTDRALKQAAVEAKIPILDLENKVIDRLEFRSENKMSGCLFESDGKTQFYLLGAPEKIFKFADQSQDLEPFKIQFELLTGQGMRVLATAQKKTNKRKIDLADNELFSNLKLTGLVSLKDPLRNEVKSAIENARNAGLRPVILTGDHKLTAKKIAQELGFQINDQNIIEGEELAALSDDDFRRRVNRIEVYARLDPSQKLKIVDALQTAGEVVAMTGDGVNDAPALKKADIGLALGSGSQVSHEVSDMVLLDDNFSTIISAIEEGRAIIDNIRKSIVYLIADSFSEIFLITITILIGLPLPVLAAQILWINLIEDGLPTIALAFEPKEKDLMQRNPNPKKLPLLTRPMIIVIATVTIASVVTLVGLYYYLLNFTSYDIEQIRTVIFAGLALATLFYAFSCKTLRRNLWEINPFTNIWLIFAFLFGVLLLLGAIYLPVLQNLLQTRSLSLFDWTLVLILSLVNITLVETSKYFTKSNGKRK